MECLWDTFSHYYSVCLRPFIVERCKRMRIMQRYYEISERTRSSMRGWPEDPMELSKIQRDASFASSREAVRRAHCMTLFVGNIERNCRIEVPVIKVDFRYTLSLYRCTRRSSKNSLKAFIRWALLEPLEHAPFLAGNETDLIG